MICQIFIKKGDFLKLNIGIIYGGKGVEHEISVLTALQVFKAIDKTKYNVELLYLTKTNNLIISSDLVDIEKYKENMFSNTAEIFLYQRNNQVFYSPIKKGSKIAKKVDCFIVCVHGDNVENGVVSSLLEFINASFTCSYNTESGILQDKEYTKIFLKHFGIDTLDYEIFNINTYLTNHLGYNTFPCIIKPCRLGSSVGINIAHEKENFENGLKMGFKFENKLIVEPLLQNVREFNCACFKYHNEYFVSAIEEIKGIGSYFTYEDKYLTKELKKDLPAIIDLTLTEEIKSITRKVYELLNLKGIIRVDFLYHNNRLVVNEINNIPGSLAYYLFAKEGISFTKLLDMQIKEAILEKQTRVFKDIEHLEVLDKKHLNNLKK